MITGTDDQGFYTDVGESNLSTTRPSTSVSYQTLVPVLLPVADTGTGAGSSKIAVPPARPATARR